MVYYYNLYYICRYIVYDVCHSHAKKLYRFLTNMKQKEQTQTTPYSRKYKTKIIKIKKKNNAHHCRISKICCSKLFCLKWMRNVAANTYYSRY